MSKNNVKLEKNKKSEDILREMTEIDQISGGSAMFCVIVGGTIAASIALCPTTKCSNACGSRD